MKSLLSFYEIPATDFDRAVDFYQKVFGLKMEKLDCGHEKMAFFPKENGLCPGAISWSSEYDFKPSKSGVLISLNCEDMDAAHAIIKANGGEITTPKTKIEDDSRGYF